MPQTRVAISAAYLAGIEAVLLLLKSLLRLAGAPGAASALSGWTTFLGWATFLLLLVLALRWLRDNVMWSVRNRLIVTYLFIGGVPVTLAVAIALLCGYLVMGDLAIFSAVSEIPSRQIQALNVRAGEAAVEPHKDRLSQEGNKPSAL